MENGNEIGNVEVAKTLKVTSIEELREVAKGTIVELPPFAPGHPFVARLKRPSMLVMAKRGQIPNTLLTSANTLFESGVGAGFDSMDQDMLQKCFEVFDLMCEASFVEPTYKELKAAGVELTDEQYMFVFGYSQNGVADLESFRSK